MLTSHKFTIQHYFIPLQIAWPFLQNAVMEYAKLLTSLGSYMMVHVAQVF